MTATPRARGARGVILLECALAVVVLAVAATVIFGVLQDSLESQSRARRRELLSDLARSAMAMIESGAASAENLNGPVPQWPRPWSDARPERGGAALGGEWELAIETQPWSGGAWGGGGGGGGLTLVAIEARWTGVSATGTITERVSLRQIVRIGARTAEHKSVPERREGVRR